MATKTYSYTFYEFPNRRVDINQLADEIRGSSFIDPKLEQIQVIRRSNGSDTCAITFSVVLAPLEAKALTTIVQAHDGEGYKQPAEPGKTLWDHLGEE
jgi:hypothetical protein